MEKRMEKETNFKATIHRMHIDKQNTTNESLPVNQIRNSSETKCIVFDMVETVQKKLRRLKQGKTEACAMNSLSEYKYMYLIWSPAINPMKIWLKMTSRFF